MNNSYEYHFLCRQLVFNVTNHLFLFLTPHKKGAICLDSAVGFFLCSAWTAQWGRTKHIFCLGESTPVRARATELPHFESDWELGRRNGVTPLGRHLLQRPVSLKVHLSNC